MMEIQRTKSTNAVLVALKNSDLGPLQRLKVRLALLDDDKREEIEQLIFMEAQKSSDVKIAVNIEAVDWDKLFNFIEKLFPIILKLIGMFQ